MFVILTAANRDVLRQPKSWRASREGGVSPMPAVSPITSRRAPLGSWKNNR